MLQQRLPADVLEVGELLEDEVPVGDEQRRGQRVDAQQRQRVRRQHDRGERGAGDHREHGGQDATGTAQVEPAEGDRAAAIELGEQQARDQETGDDEEQVDAEETALGVEPVGVEHHDTENGQGAQTVDADDARGLGSRSGSRRVGGRGRHGRHPTRNRRKTAETALSGGTSPATSRQ